MKHLLKLSYYFLISCLTQNDSVFKYLYNFNLNKFKFNSSNVNFHAKEKL